MEIVGIRELKRNLSEYLRSVKAGKKVIITDRKKEIAVIVPFSKVDDQGKIFNTELLNTWELGNLLDLAEVTTVSAVTRKESRGAHARDDFTKRDDDNWLKHTLAWQRNGEIELRYKPVVFTKFKPKERVY